MADFTFYDPTQAGQSANCSLRGEQIFIPYLEISDLGLRFEVQAGMVVDHFRTMEGMVNCLMELGSHDEMVQFLQIDIWPQICILL